eukprot:scaffold21202_cov34-Attheya_sp.AAC.2
MVELPTKRGQTRSDIIYGHNARKTRFIGAFPDQLNKGTAPRARELESSSRPRLDDILDPFQDWTDGHTSSAIG